MAYQPKSYRKFIAGAATAAVVASSFAGVAGAASVNDFTDVNDNYKAAVEYLVSKGIQGTSATTFGTYDNIKRVDAAVFVVKALGLDVNAAPASGFTDVPERAVKEVNALKAAGITNGKTATEFGAQDLITRGELAIWLDRAFDLKGEGDVSKFTDATGIYTEAIKALVANNITQGTSATTFGTKDNAKRGDFAIFVKRAADTVTLEESNTVKSVTALNAKQIQIKFNTAVDKDTVLDDNGTKDIADDLLLSTAVEITELDGQAAITEGSAKAELSADGKTLTITAGGAEYFNGHYTVVVTDNVKTEEKVAFEKSTFNLNVDDTTRPTVKGVTYEDFQTATVEFSEPIATKGTVTYKLADGTALTADPTEAVVDGKLQIDLSGIAAADEDKDITVTIVGAADYNGNLVSPNPVTVTVKKDTSDTVKPTVSSITVTGNASFDIKFSEKLIADPTIAAVGGQAATVVKDTTDSTLYHVTLAGAVSGLQTVTVSAFADLSNNPGDAYSRVVNFTADETKPELSSSKVEQIDGVEYLVLTYNEYVNPTNNVTFNATYLKDYVSTDVALTTDTTATPTNDAFSLYKPVDGKSKSVKLDLSSLTDAAEYTVTLPEGLVTDLYGNDSTEAKDVKFKRTSNASTDAPKLDATFDGNGVQASATDNNKLTVQFDNTVDGASAINVANYKVEGATVASVKLVSNTGKAQVELTLEKDSNVVSGSRTITVSGVKSQSGKVMKTATTSEVLVENVRPTVTKAELTATNTITLTFSENMNPNTIDDASDAAANDFTVFIGGVEYTGTIAEAVGSDDKTFTLTLGDALTASQLASGVVVKKASTIDATDANGNELNFTSITVAQ